MSAEWRQSALFRTVGLPRNQSAGVQLCMFDDAVALSVSLNIKEKLSGSC